MRKFYRTKDKYISIFMVFIMIFSLLTSNVVFAEDNNETIKDNNETNLVLGLQTEITYKENNAKVHITSENVIDEVGATDVRMSLLKNEEVLVDEAFTGTYDYNVESADNNQEYEVKLNYISNLGDEKEETTKFVVNAKDVQSDKKIEENKPAVTQPITPKVSAAPVAPKIAETDVAAIGDVGYVTLQEAITAASNDDTVVLLKDATENINIPSGKKMTLDINGKTLTGTGETSVIINKGNLIVKGNNGIITGGYNIPSASIKYGGGFYCVGGSIKIYDLIIKDNGSLETKLSGSGLCLTYTNAYLENCIIESNYSSNTGAGIYAFTNDTYRNNIVLKNCTIKSNIGLSSGAGLYGSGPLIMEINDSKFDGNVLKSANDAGTAIYCKNNVNSLTLNKTDIINNKFVNPTDENGSINGNGTVYFENNSITNINFNECTICHNMAKYGSFIYADTLKNKMNISNCTIEDNQAINGDGTIYLTNNLAEVIIDSCTAIGNKVIKGGFLYSSFSQNIINFINCTINDNIANSDGGGVYFNGRTDLIHRNLISFTDCTIKNNTALNCAGGIYSKWEDLTLVGNIIESNTAANCGGVYFDSSILKNLKITSGSICKNVSKTNNGNDISLNQIFDAQIIEASNMNNDYNLWSVYENGSSKLVSDAISIVNDTSRRHIYITAVTDNLQEVVKNLTQNKEYKYLKNAIDEANDNDVIQILEIKNPLSRASESVIIDKPLTIDLNGQSWNGESDENSVFDITESGSLTLINSHTEVQGVVNTSSDYSINNAGKLILGSGIKFGKPILLANQSNIIKLSNKAIEYDSIPVILSNNIIDVIDDSNSIQLNIIEGIVGDNLSSLIDNKKIDLKNTLSHYCTLNAEDNLIKINKTTPEGIYLDGVNGNDTNPGTLREPVKSFDVASKLLNNSQYDTIYIKNKVSITDEQTWLLGENKKIQRFAEYKGDLIAINSSKKLTLSKIVIDGNGDEVSGLSVGTLISNNGGTLNINEETKLQNNNRGVTKSSDQGRYGGAVYSSGGTINMNAGEITNNKSAFGAAICLTSSATLIINGGTISDNNSLYGSVCAIRGAHIVMNNGLITKNSSNNGGAINLGTNNTANIHGYPTTTLVMNGGSITANKVTGCGGGIYIQCECVATINGGIISGNTANGLSEDGGTVGFGLYAGGGIYVNGGRSFTDDSNTEVQLNNGILYLYNAFIHDNTSAYNGAGIAVCPTGTVKIYPTEGAIIYQNNALTGILDEETNTSKKAVEVYCEKAKDPHNERFISEFMLGYSAYKWYLNDVITHKLAKVEQYQNTSNEIGLDNDLNNNSLEVTKANAIINDTNKVIIANNTSGSNGGGIGSNGDVFIGKEAVYLNLTKIVENDDVNSTKSFEFTIALKDKDNQLVNGTYRLSDGNSITFTNGEAKIQLKNNENIFIMNLPVGTQFNIVENLNDLNYKNILIQMNGETVDNANGVLENDVTNVVFTNKKFGSLTIIKETTGNTTPAGTQFVITGPFDYSKTITYADFKNVNGKMTYVINDLAIGEYTVTEIKDTAEITDYTLVVSGDGKVTLTSADNNKEIAIKNTYTQDKGKLIIIKETTGALTPAGTKFTVSGPNNYIKNFTYDDFEDKVYIIDNLVVGEYTVTEIEESGKVVNYTLVVEGNNQAVEIKKDQTANVTITNKYTEILGKLTIVKKSVGDNSTPDETTFTITGPNGYEKIVKYSEFKDGKITLDNLSMGKYKVSESGADIKDYTLVVTGDKEATLTETDTDKTITVTNTYTSNKEATVTIYKADQDKHFLNGAAFKMVKVVDGKEEFVDEQSRGSTFVFKNLTDGIYRVYETRVPKGYKGFVGYFEFEIIDLKVYFDGKLKSTFTVVNTNDETEPKVTDDKIVETNDNQNALGYIGLSIVSLALLYLLKKKKSLE